MREGANTYGALESVMLMMMKSRLRKVWDGSGKQNGRPEVEVFMR